MNFNSSFDKRWIVILHLTKMYTQMVAQLQAHLLPWVLGTISNKNALWLLANSQFFQRIYFTFEKTWWYLRYFARCFLNYKTIFLLLSSPNDLLKVRTTGKLHAAAVLCVINSSTPREINLKFPNETVSNLY